MKVILPKPVLLAKIHERRFLGRRLVHRLRDREADILTHLTETAQGFTENRIIELPSSLQPRAQHASLLRGPTNLELGDVK
jgi:hypothetical protein